MITNKQAALGLIPMWQFSANPGPGGGVGGLAAPHGHGHHAHGGRSGRGGRGGRGGYAPEVIVLDTDGCSWNAPCAANPCCDGYRGGQQIRGLGDATTDLNAIFDSWWWQNRQPLVIGSVVALTLGVIGGLAVLLK